MANRNTQGFPSPEEDPRFHDTYQFLRRYRDATYSLKVVVHQMEHQFKLQYDNDTDKFLDSIYAAGADLTGSDIEQRAKSIARSNQMLKLLESSIDLLRNNGFDEHIRAALIDVAELPGRRVGKVDEPVAVERTAIIDAHGHAFVVEGVGDFDLSAES